jgi:2-succinyl-5-enolpyruvyl-6-hydroxy-3-cyclohexene-1-carboxylate synthase
MAVKNQAQANLLWSKILVEELVRSGLSNFCIAPGGRSCPLVAAVNAHPQAQIQVHQDERGLAFFALGQAKSSRKPTAIICTAGTAVANFHPAVLEAYYSEVPLLILSSDLPWEESMRGVNQGISQSHLFGEHLRWSFDFPAPTGEFSWKALVSNIDYAISRARKGPVHLNCRFRAPMTECSGSLPQPDCEEYRAWSNSSAPRTKYIDSPKGISHSDMATILERLERASRGIIVVGQLEVDEDTRVLLELARHMNWPILSDPLSQLRFCSEPVDGVVHSSHFTIFSSEESFRSENRPDLVLHLGGDILLRPPHAPFHRGPHSFLKKPSQGCIHVRESDVFQDPFYEVDLRVDCSVAEFCKAIIDSSTEFRASELLEPLATAERKVSRYLSTQSQIEKRVTEPWAVRTVLDLLPENGGLFIANSLSMREVDYLLSEQAKNIRCGSLHGLKGIDGTLATACGFASGLQAATTLIVGDVATIHDLNSLMMCARSSQPLVILLLNNDGGQIFSYVDASKHPSFERCFLTPHGMDFRSAALQFSVKYFCPENIDELKVAYTNSIELAGATIIEIKTHRDSLIESQQQIFSNALSFLSTVS